MGEAGFGGDIIFDKQFTNFHFKVEWMIADSKFPDFNPDFADKKGLYRKVRPLSISLSMEGLTANLKVWPISSLQSFSQKRF